MKTATTNVVLSRTMLRETIALAARFLNSANKPEILRKLQAAGYTKAESEEGWKLYLRVTRTATAPEPTAPENKAAEAVAQISAWVSQGLARARAVWQRKFPEVLAYVFQDIDGSDNGAVYDLATFLDRCKDLQNGAERKATRKTDHAALAALAERGIGDATLKHLGSLLEVAQKQPAVTPIEVKVNADERTAAITELYVWLRDWRETARAVIKNRTQLISLGIGKKRAKKAAARAPTLATTAPAASSSNDGKAA
jgi:hypothetical protein